MRYAVSRQELASRGQKFSVRDFTSISQGLALLSPYNLFSLG